MCRFALLVPTFNHAGPLPKVLKQLEPLALPIIVVDDGSTDATPSLLAAWYGGEHAGGHVHGDGNNQLRRVVTHKPNKGKAAALLTGFAAAREAGFTHAITFDSDGQHFASDVPALIAAARHSPDAIILGARPREIPSTPWKSTIGRRFSNFCIGLASGVRVSDSQSGLRVYPLQLIEGLKAKASRYGFETEVLTRAGWAGIGVVEVPITSIYEVEGGRITHFKVLRDSRQSLAMHAALITRSILPGNPVPRVLMRSQTSAVNAPPGTIWRRAWWSINPLRIWRMVRGDEQARERFAASVAVGLVMAILPLYGVKTVACLWLSARLRLHPGVVIAGSSMSTPPIGFLLIGASIVVGHAILARLGWSHAEIPAWNEINLDHAKALLAEWFMGSVFVAAAVGGLAYFAIRLALIRGRSRKA